MQPVVLLITTPDLSTAEIIARRLVEDRLAACVNIVPGVRSFYRWEGKMNEDQEILMIVKTRQELLEDQIIPAVRSIHPYQVPEMITLPISGGLTAYLDWIGEETR